MQIFLYEPNPTIAESVRKRLDRVGTNCVILDETFFHPETVRAVRSSLTATAILIGDDEKAIEKIKVLRDNACLSPIIALFSCKDSRKTIETINAGADDAVVAPYTGDELMARINAITRRSYGHVSSSVTIGDVQAYFDGRDPEVDGKGIHLSGREHAIFTHLALQHGRVISKEQLYEAVYGLLDNQPYAKVIDVYVCKLRKKLEGATGHRYIETVYGRGYKLSPPTEDKRPQAEPSVATQGRNSAAFVGANAPRTRFRPAA